MRPMSRTLVALTILAVAANQSVSAQQQKPNFSGRWVITSPAGSAGQEQIVTQDDKTLTVQHASEGGGHKLSYQLDGVERRMAIPGRAGADITMLANAAWDAGRIVVTTNISFPTGMKTQSKDVWSLDTQGRLVIDSTETGPTGPGPSIKMIHIRKK